MSDKKITIKDVAKAAGVSISVVSYILNETPGQSFTEETKKRVFDAAKELSYTPNFIAKGMRNRKSMNIGMVLYWNISDNIFNEILIGVSKITKQLGYNIVLCIPSNGENEFDYVDIFKKRQIDGIIFISPFGTNNNYDEEKHLKLIKDEKIPAVIINGRTADKDLNYIHIDFYSTTYFATKYLLELGHRRIAYLLPDETETALIQANERLSGFCDAMIDAKCDNTELVDSTNLDQTAENIKAGVGPTAVVLNKINYAQMFYDKMKEFEIRIPEDVSVISASNDVYAKYLYTPLTTVMVPLKDMGEMGAKVLFDILKGNDYKVKLKLANTIFERKSCKII